MKIKPTVTEAIALSLFVLLIFVGMSSMLLGSEIEHMEKEDEFYCEMVQIFEDSKGENGWPNYKGRDCASS